MGFLRTLKNNSVNPFRNSTPKTYSESFGLDRISEPVPQSEVGAETPIRIRHNLESFHMRHQQWHVIESHRVVRLVEAVLLVGLFALGVGLLAGCAGSMVADVDGHRLSVSRSSSLPAPGLSFQPSAPPATSPASEPLPSQKQNPASDANGNPVRGS